MGSATLKENRMNHRRVALRLGDIPQALRNATQ
jgi:hypothetical protein